MAERRLEGDRTCDGYMTTEDMMRFTGEVLDWSRVQIREAE